MQRSEVADLGQSSHVYLCRLPHTTAMSIEVLRAICGLSSYLQTAPVDRCLFIRFIQRMTVA